MRVRTVLYFALYALALIAVDGLPDATRFLARTRGAGAAVVLVLAYALTLAATFVLFAAKSKAIRVLTHNAAIVSLATTAASRALNRSGFGIEEARIAIHESALADQALVSFVHLWAPAMLAAILAGAIAVTAGERIVPRVISGRVAALVATALVVVMMLPAMAWYASFLPSTVRAPAVFIAAIRRLDAPRAPIRVAPPSTKRGLPRHVVLIVDESVRGDFPRFATRGAIDFGVATAATNCSATTNYVLRHGLQPRDLPDVRKRSRGAPTIFDFARAAGRRTVLIDAQSSTSKPRNLMTAAELARIDEHVVIAKLHPHAERAMLDRLALHALIARLDATTPSFIWLNKYGAHFQYEHAYPSTTRDDTPNLGEKQPHRNELLTRNSYVNAVRWASADFLLLLERAIERRDAIVIYTSDHGQSFPSEGSTYPHCVSTDPPAAQGRVPLKVITSNSAFANALATAARAQRDRASHYQIFPTLLAMFGQDADEIRRTHGPLLTDAPPATQFFSGDLFGRGRWDWTNAAPSRGALSPVSAARDR